ncbi:lysophospholipid acyltransferase 7-like [Helicoverpa zea]|uniref:lysophospholipid acyltransferase 7-like n=1 Tax=Helicoverpa zea TaxID=7113 RepID=UPI001F59C68F|nr:lysophospholipid acyltransferase 7-like [Helicoverpa zea]
MYSFSDLVYYSSLLACISLGSYYKQIEDPATKRSYGTGLGILITCMVCGPSVVHSVLMVWGNIIIIKCCKKQYIHHLSLAYTWLYLIYMNFNLNITNNVLWIHQAVALRLVGLAFEINLAEKAKRQSPPKMPVVSNNSVPKINDVANKVSTQPAQSTNGGAKSSANKFTLSDMGFVPTEPSAVDIIAYAYYFIGLHKGPYYRWKIFNEHFKTPFGILGDCRVITEQKLKKAFVCAILYLFLSRKFPVQVYHENDFYLKHGTDFRYLYNIPQMFIYVLQYQVVMMLCTSVCTESGFGVYPTKTQPIPGHGPSARFSLLNLATITEEVALEQEYNFAMLRSFENEKLLIGPRMRDTLRGWDMPTRYWFWAHTYKGMVKTNKEVRSALSFLAWTVWCGPTLQQLIISATLWVHLHLENEYGELYDTNVSMKIPWDIGFSIMRLFCLTYLTPCLILNDSAVVLRYYNSIFWVYHMVLLFLILGAVGVYKERTMARTSGL